MANFERGLELWESLTATLNEQITVTGKKIDINNPTIWNNWLHQLTNQDWEDMLAAFAECFQEDSNIAKAYHVNNVERARSTLLRGDPNKRILDQKINKKIAWATMMTLREVMNGIRDVNIPNEDAPKPKNRKTQVEHTKEYTRVTIWHDLFDLE